MRPQSTARRHLRYRTIGCKRRNTDTGSLAKLGKLNVISKLFSIDQPSTLASAAPTHPCILDSVVFLRHYALLLTYLTPDKIVVSIGLQYINVRYCTF